MSRPEWWKCENCVWWAQWDDPDTLGECSAFVDIPEIVSVTTAAPSFCGMFRPDFPSEMKAMELEGLRHINLDPKVCDDAMKSMRDAFKEAKRDQCT